MLLYVYSGDWHLEMQVLTFVQDAVRHGFSPVNLNDTSIVEGWVKVQGNWILSERVDFGSSRWMIAEFDTGLRRKNGYK